MSQTRFRAAYLLSAVIAALMVVASTGGLFLDGLYRDNLWVTSQFRGSDLVRLLVAVPLLVAALIGTMRGSQRAQLVWLGMLWLTLYDYAFYVFGAAFNAFFLVYVALFSLAIFALLFALSGVDARAIYLQFRGETPVRWISGYLLLLAVALGGLWITQSLHFIFTGRVPQPVVDSGHPTGLVYALDLSLVVPASVLGAVWLWERRPWGYVLAVMVNVKAVVYNLALIGMALFANRAGVPEAGNLVPLWGLFAAGSLTATALLLGNMQAATAQGASPPPVDQAPPYRAGRLARG